MKLKRFVALAAALVLCASFITSCDTFGAASDAIDTAKIVKAAEDNLANTAYTVNVSTTFTTDDEDIKDTIASLEEPEIKYSINGKSFIISMDSTVGEFDMEKSYTVVDEILYHKSTVSLGEKTITVKEKAPIGLTERNMLISKAGIAASIGYEDFDSVTASVTEEGFKVGCTEIKDEALTGLCNILSSRFKGTDAVVNIGNVSYEIEINGNKFSKTTLTCNCKIMLDGTEYDFVMTIVENYDFLNAPAIKTPADADSYADALYSDIVK